MYPIPKDPLVRLLCRTPARAILRAADRCDGRSILPPARFKGTGLPQEFVRHFTRTYESDRSPSGTIRVRGRPVCELEGVRGLNLLRFFARGLGVPYTRADDLDEEARNIRRALHAYFHGLPAR